MPGDLGIPATPESIVRFCDDLKTSLLSILAYGHPVFLDDLRLPSQFLAPSSPDWKGLECIVKVSPKGPSH